MVLPYPFNDHICSGTSKSGLPRAGAKERDQVGPSPIKRAVKLAGRRQGQMQSAVVRDSTARRRRCYPATSRATSCHVHGRQGRRSEGCR